MSHLERLFAALYVSEGWNTAADYLPRRKLYCRARAVVVFDRVLTGRHDEEGGKL